MARVRRDKPGVETGAFRGERLRELLERRTYTQSYFAGLMDVHQPDVAHWINGCDPNLRRFRRICLTLADEFSSPADIDSYLLGFTDRKPWKRHA